MKAKIYTLLSVVLLALSMPVQAQNEVKRLNKLFDKTVKDIVGGITSSNTEDYGDEYAKSYQFTIPRSQAKTISRLDEALREATPKAYQSWTKKAGGGISNTKTIYYGERHRKTYTFGKNINLNYNLVAMEDPTDTDKRHVYVLAWGEKGDNIIGGIFHFYNSNTMATLGASEWFYIKFRVGGYYLTAKGDGAYVQTDRIEKGHEDAALWQWVKEGDAYHFFNKQGYQLYCDGNRIKAGSNVYGMTEFYIIQSERSRGLFEISIKPSPYIGDMVFLNQMGSAGRGRLICTYSSYATTDNTNWVQFVDETGKLVAPSDVMEKTPRQRRNDDIEASSEYVAGVDTAGVVNETETKAPQTSADFMEQLNNLATFFTLEGNWCKALVNATTATYKDSYAQHLNLWTGATNKIMRLCKEHGNLLDKDERTIVYNLLAKLKPMCDNGYDSLGAMIEVAQKAVKK